MNDHSIGVNEYNLPVIIRGNVRIEWDDPTDECDKNILRFDVSRFDGKDWEAISDGSYCTQVEANTAHENLIEHLVHFMGEIYDDVSEHGTAKRVCESLSWTK
jgi:hypothetical protein